MKAPNITKGLWTVEKWGGDPENEQRPEGVSDCFIHAANGDVAYMARYLVNGADATLPDAKMLAAAPMLAEALNELVKIELLRASMYGRSPQTQKAVEALLAAGYTEE